MTRAGRGPPWSEAADPERDPEDAPRGCPAVSPQAAAVLLVLALGAAAALLARRRDGGMHPLGLAAWAVGLLALGVVALEAGRGLVLQLAPLPLERELPAYLAAAAVVGALPLLAAFLPRRAALWAPVVVLAAAVPLVFVGTLLANSFAVLTTLLALVGALAPRSASLALLGARPWAPGGVGGLLLAMVILPTLGALALGLAWPSNTRAHAEWAVEVEPTQGGPYVLRVPFLESDDPATQDVLSALAARVRVAQGNARVERAGDAFLVHAEGGRVRLFASYDFHAGPYGHFVRPDARLVDEDWTLHGVDGAFVSWRLGRGCDEQLDGQVALGAARDAPAPVTPSRPSVPPCPRI